MYTCIMIILYMINLVDAPSVHMVPGLIFYLFNINYNKANLKQKNQYCIYLINLGLLTQQHLRFFLYFQSLKMNISVFNPCILICKQRIFNHHQKNLASTYIHSACHHVELWILSCSEDLFMYSAYAIVLNYERFCFVF